MNVEQRTAINQALRAEDELATAYYDLAIKACERGSPFDVHKYMELAKGCRRRSNTLRFALTEDSSHA